MGLRKPPQKLRNSQRVVTEGWTVLDFKEHMRKDMDLIMKNRSWIKPFKSKLDIREYLISYQPFYKKEIKELTEYFSIKYNLNE